MKQAIVVVGFGVGDAQVKKRCIDSLLEDLSRSFGEDYDIYEAWTSDFLRRKMAKGGYIYPNLAGVLVKTNSQVGEPLIPNLFSMRRTFTVSSCLLSATK